MSSGESPVTQIAEVAIKSASTKPIERFALEVHGNKRTIVPIAIITAKLETVIFVGVKNRRNIFLRFYG